MSEASMTRLPPWRGTGAPMLAVAGDPPARARWIEFKFDGWRARADTGRAAGPRLVSRRGRVITDRFPEITEALTDVPGDRMTVLDGELVVPGAGGLPDFEALQARARATATPARRAASPANYVAFDLLALDDHDLTGLALRERRALLDGLGLDEHPRLVCSPVFTDVDPAAVLTAAREHSMEGVLTKMPGARYASGQRSKAWIKTVITQRATCTVGGFTQGRSRRPGTVGSLLLGQPTPHGGLAYLGEVATGWNRAEHTRLTALARELVTEDCPFTDDAHRLPAGATFLTPLLRGHVAYREHRPGQLLRHPSWKGLVNEDRPPSG